MRNIITALLLLFTPLLYGQSHNSSVERFDYRDEGGLIIIEMSLNGVQGEFLLDLAGKSSILEEYLPKFKLTRSEEFSPNRDKFLYKNIPAKGVCEPASLNMGNNVFSDQIDLLIIDDIKGKLKELGVVGIVSGTPFRGSVLTLDRERKSITTSVPFRPSYMSLRERANMKVLPGSTIEIDIVSDGKKEVLLFDTWHTGLVLLPKKGGTYKDLSLANISINNPDVTIDRDNIITKPSVGLGLLDYGVISIDFERGKVYYQSYDKTVVVEEATKELATIVPGKMNEIGREEFIEYIFDYKNNKEFVLKGDKPVVIDFWATWCGPCMRMMPEMEKMAEHYKDRVIFYKVNADKEKDICNHFNVQALPTMFFIPVGGKPIIDVGAQPQKYLEIIETQLLKSK